MFTRSIAVVILCLTTTALAEEPSFSRLAIFPAEKKHNHSSCVVELEGGDLLVTWYRGTGERTADDVQIMGSRLIRNKSEWEPRFVMADTPGYPDCNPALFAAPDRSLWLFWPTILDHRWEGALLKFARSTEYSDASVPPVWSREGVLHITPVGFADAMSKALAGLELKLSDRFKSVLDRVSERSKDELYQRLGWMPRVHVTVLPSGRWLLPLYSDTFSASLVAISDDRGTTWRASGPMIGFGNIQPSIVRRNDGTLVAFMRDNGPPKKIRLSESTDEGETWGPVRESDLPNPGAGVEAIRLQNGHWALVWNDTEKGRNSLALSISEDEGKTWPITRHIERNLESRESYHYPSLLQTSDGMIHVTYTHGGMPEGSTIAHARFNEAWVRQGDSAK